MPRAPRPLLRQLRRSGDAEKRDEGVGIQDLTSRGLTFSTNGLAKTILEYEDVSDMNAAQLSMIAEQERASDRVAFDTKGLPLPICYKGFFINARTLASSRASGDPLDTTQIAVATTKVIEKIETMLFTGASTYKYGGYTIYGYMDHTSRDTGNLATNWDDSGADPVTDVLAMKQGLIDVKHHGPYILYVPTNFSTALDENYEGSSTTMPITIRERILKIDRIEDVKVAHFLTDDNVILVELKPQTVRMVVGLEVQVVEWQTMGGLVSHYLVWTIMIPQIRADQAGNCGVCHYAAAL